MSDPSERPRRRRRQTQPPPPPPQGSVARGAILVVIALVIGVLLLRDDDSSATQVSVGTDTPASVDDGDGDGAGDGGDVSDTSSTTPTTEAARPPAEVKVLVANGSSVNGAAGTQTDELEALGYVTATPTNAAERVPATIVYYTAGFEPEARQLAGALGLADTAVAKLPAVAPVDDLQLSNLLVVLGPDLATGG